MRDCFRNASLRKVVAFLRPYKLDDVKEALVQLGGPGDLHKERHL
jgi:hypothetical protein